jgi:hypothetical protein
MENAHLLSLAVEKRMGPQPVIKPDTVQMPLCERIPGGMLLTDKGVQKEKMIRICKVHIHPKS